MKKKDVEERKKRIESRIADLKDLKSQNKQFASYCKSRYFQDALIGKHPYLHPAESREEYLDRHQHFAHAVEKKISALVEESKDLPVVKAQKWDSPRSLRIGIIADRFLYDSLKDSAQLIPVTPENYTVVVPNIDLLLITSAWRGLEDEWLNLPIVTSDAYKSLADLVVPLAHAESVPVAFYSKEDPPNFNKFKSLAKLAQHIFTSAVECIPKYRELLGKEVSVDLLEFSVNYKYHNPIGCMRHRGREILFAGSWLEHKYPDRRRGAQTIFDGLISAGAELLIADRNLGLDGTKVSNTERYLFPEKYLPYIHKPIEHDELLRLQRLLPLGINLNSVVNSETMYANRAIELQAMGTMLISNYSGGLNTQFPHIRMPDSQSDTADIYRSLDERSIRESQIAGIRAAFSGNTAFDRIDRIATCVGLEASPPDRVVYVTGIGGPPPQGFADSQSCSVPIVCIEPERISEVTGGPHGDLILTVSADKEYGPFLVQDAINAFKYSEADIVYLAEIDSAGLFEYTSPETDFSSTVEAVWLNSGESFVEAKKAAKLGLKIGTDVIRRSTGGLSLESWEPTLSIVVPVYNNGAHLKYKCFESIRRSSVFDRSEVLLIDDGSDDKLTSWILEELSQTYPNVRLFRFETGGSGSASRPRNKGLELARGPYVTYLDPDNELTCDGYTILLERLEETGANFAIGNMVRWKEKRTTIKNSAVLKKALDPNGALDRLALSKIDYQPMSIQALVAETEWLRGCGLEQPLGAVGQDSYFFQQMLYYAESIAVVPKPIHIYYAAVANSTVNRIGPKFYQKYIPLERERSKWLRSVGLMDDYVQRRLERFVKGWFIAKLSFVAAEEKKQCIELIRELVSYYDVAAWQDPDLQKFFREDVDA